MTPARLIRTLLPLAVMCTLGGMPPPARGAAPGEPPSLGSAAFPLGVAAGEVTSSRAILWTRTQAPRPVVIEVAPVRDFSRGVLRKDAQASADRDNTVKVRFDQLQPRVRYFYRFRSGTSVSETGTFLTAPPRTQAVDVAFAYSGDSDGTRVGQAPAHGPFAILDQVRRENPDFFIYLGDTIYADSSLARAPATTVEGYRRKYQENRRAIFLRNLLRSTSVIAVADDHEVLNDYDPQTVEPERLRAGLQAFREYMPLPEETEGPLFRALRWGREVELIVLDERSYRSPQAHKGGRCDNPAGSGIPDLGPTYPPPLRQAFAPLVRQFALPAPPACLAAIADGARTMLGPAQKSWLRETLLRSDATWKVIVNEVAIQELFGNPYDRWEGYAAERAEILRFIRDQGIRNVVWITADLHATIVNEVRISTFAPRFEPTGMIEVIVGPIATTTYAGGITSVVGPAAVPAYAGFLAARPPQGMGATCVSLDQFSYATVQASASAKTLTVTPKDSSGRPICPAPILIRAAP